MRSDIEKCIALIRRTQDLNDINESDIEELLELISPFLINRFGKDIFVQVETLLRARNFDRAVKLLNNLPKTAYLFRGKRGVKLLMIIITLIGVLTAILVELNTGGAEDETYGTDWASTDAVIITSRVSSKINLEGRSEDYPLIEFRYEVNGVSYVSDSIVYDGFDDVADIIDNYPEGEQLQINYNTEDPQEAYLSVENNLSSYFFVLSLILFVFIFLYYFGKQKRKMKNRN